MNDLGTIDDIYIYTNPSIVFLRLFVDGKNTDIIYDSSGKIKNQFRVGEKIVLSQSMIKKLKTLYRLNYTNNKILQYNHFAINFSHSFANQIISKLQGKMQRGSTGALSLPQKYSKFRDYSLLNNKYRLHTSKFIQEIKDMIDRNNLTNNDILTDIYLKYIDLVDRTDLYDFSFDRIYDILYIFVSEMLEVDFSKHHNIIVNTSNNFYLLQVTPQFDFLDPVIPFSRELEIKFDKSPNILMISLSEQNYMLFDEFLYENSLYC